MSHPSVLEIFPAFSERFEGRFVWPYLDVEGYPTVGIGCLIYPVGLALQLPWRVLGGALATSAQVVAQWEYLRNSHELARLGARAAEHATELRLSDSEVDALLAMRMARNEAVLSAAFVGWKNYPADAQLAIHSMAWALGAGFAKEFPRFKRAAEAGDWVAAAKECTIDGEDKNKGLVPRNAANRICLANAARVIANPIALRATEVYWPLELT